MANVGISETYRDAFTIDKFLTNATETMKAGQYNKLGEYKVEAGEVVRLGFGSNNTMEGANGRIYLSVKDNATTPVQLHGKIRFVVHSPQGRPLRILAEYSTHQLLTDQTDRTKQVPFSAFGPFVSEDKKLVVEFQPTADCTVAKANTFLLMDVTQGVTN